jgi:hypothetical protein
MRLDAGLRIGRALGVIDIPQTGNPTRAEQIVQFLDFFGLVHVGGSFHSEGYDQIAKMRRHLFPLP